MSKETIFRILFAMIFSSTLVISGTFRRKARMKGEQIKRIDEGLLVLFTRLLLALLLFTLFSLYIFNPDLLKSVSINLPDYIRYAGVAIGGLCIPFIYTVFTNIGRNISETVLTKKNQELVMTGPYRYIRHPLYTGAIVEFFALGLISENWLILALSLITGLIFRIVVIPREEKNLIDIFGNAYLEYRKKTGAMFFKVFQD